MKQRFNDVAEAFVFFDVDDKRVLSKVKFEAGLFRMGLKSILNPEQLLVRVCCIILWCVIFALGECVLYRSLVCDIRSG